ncbi:MAG: cell division protein FtsL [Clostridiales bacterium]|nr:cell division protein FtsL [Clostridiales bacterium]
MARGSTGLSHNSRGNARPVWQPYEPPKRKEGQAAPAQKSKADYHPTVPLKTLTPAELRAICLVVLVVTAVAMGIILLAAEAAVTQKEINNLRRSIAAVDDDIANLKIEIEQSQNMQSIRTRAQEELGLRHPAFDQYVYVNELPEPESDFGRYIKERAYGGARSQAPTPEEE